METSRKVVQALAQYLKAQIANAVVVVGLYIVAFAITGVPWWPLLGLLCGVLNLIPYFGSVLALALGLTAKWDAAGDWVQVAYVGVAWLLIQVIDGFVLSPRAAGRAGVNPILSILITLAAGLIFGPIGMLIAVPAAAVILVVARALRRSQAPRTR